MPTVLWLAMADPTIVESIAPEQILAILKTELLTQEGVAIGQIASNINEQTGFSY